MYLFAKHKLQLLRLKKILNLRTHIQLLTLKIKWGHLWIALIFYYLADKPNQAVAPDGKITGGSGLLETSGFNDYTAPSNEEEPEPIR